MPCRSLSANPLSGDGFLPFLALYLAKGRGLSVEAAGAIASLYGAGMMLAGFGGGILADRLGRRTVMLISLLGGPPLMLGATRAMLDRLGVPPENVHFDDFGA